MTTIKTFADELAGVTLEGVTTRFEGIPKTLFPSELPAQWADMPAALIDPFQNVGSFGTFDAGAARYTGFLFVAVCELSEGLPDDQREAILDMAVEVEAWAITTPYTVEITTAARIPVAGREYRGVTARVTAPDMD